MCFAEVEVQEECNEQINAYPTYYDDAMMAKCSKEVLARRCGCLVVSCGRYRRYCRWLSCLRARLFLGHRRCIAWKMAQGNIVDRHVHLSSGR